MYVLNTYQLEFPKKFIIIPAIHQLSITKNLPLYK